MKTINKYFSAFPLFILFFFFLSPLLISSQSFDENIHIPTGNGNGSLYGDINVAGNFVFMYSFYAVTAYSAANGDFITSFAFPDSNNFGKYNPIFYKEKYWVSDLNAMTFNDDADILYVVSPDIKIMHISTSDTTPSLLAEQYIPHDSIRNHFNPVHGANIIKYNADQKKLYWIIEGRNHDSNYIGSFHKRVRYFSIFSVDSEGSLNLIHEEFIKASDNYLDANISDIECNTDTSVAGNEFFYLSKLNRLEVWKIENPSKNPTISLFKRHNIDTTAYSCYFYKFGKMLYINDTAHNIHKLIALPYRYLDHPLSNPDIYFLDCNHGDDSTSIVWNTIPAPSKRILDAEYIPENQHLIISYTPDTSNTIGQAGQGSDIAVFEYDSASGSFSSTPIQYLNTNVNYPVYEPFDLNASFDLEIINETDLMLSKKDQIVQLHYQNQEYTDETRKYAENNFFLKSVNTNFAKTFVLNTASNGIDIIQTNDTTKSKINTAFPVYDICASNTFDKLYFFNKLNVFSSSGVYIYDPQTEELLSINEDSQAQNNIYVPVGDCIYNPFQNHFLISENASFGNRAASVKVINNDVSNTLITNIELIDSEENNAYYAKRMFIAPNGQLYVTANMRYDTSETPKVFVFEAKESGSSLYSLIEVVDVGNMLPSGYNGVFEFYSAYFCYNRYNKCVYMTIHPTENIIDPYNSVPNTMFSSFNSYTGNNGFLVRISGNSSIKTALNYPGKIICPASMGAFPNSRFGNKMYIIGKNFYEVDPLSLTEYAVRPDTNESFNDITYSPVDDRIYCLRDDSLSKATHREINIYCIDTSNSFYSFDKIYSTEGQATSLFHNPYDNQLYFHQKTDENKLGNTPVRLLTLDYDPEVQSLTIDSVSLEMASIYPEVDHNGDFRFYLYNTTSQVIDPYSNTIYIPNGGHSCVSKVSFTPYEPLLLEEGGWTWLSLPRMNRNYNAAVWIPDLLDNNIEPGNYQDSSKLQNLTLGTNNDIVESYFDDEYGWNYEGYLDSIRSTYGYKLYLKYENTPDKSFLFLEGNLYNHFDPDCNNCQIDLIGADKYWVGYYYPIAQNIIDAIPDEIEPLISVIKGQYFTCYGAPQSDGSVQWNCAINKRGTIINYGDMVEIIPVTGDSILNFYWTINNNTPTDQEKAETDYYAFTETSDYTPIFIELDTANNPLEIGAFVNDSCIGASTVLPEDSVVLVPAYSDNLNGEIYFEEYYGTQKSNQPPITEYYVTNHETRIREKRLIHTRERQDYFIVSFKNIKTAEKEEAAEDAWIKCRPNPLRSNGTISCYVPDDGFAEIMLYNITSTKQLVLHSGMLSAGTHEIKFSAKDMSGVRLSNGTYILSMKSATYQTQTKIVVIQ